MYLLTDDSYKTNKKHTIGVGRQEWDVPYNCSRWSHTSRLWRGRNNMPPNVFWCCSALITTQDSDSKPYFDLFGRVFKVNVRGAVTFVLSTNKTKISCYTPRILWTGVTKNKVLIINVKESSLHTRRKGNLYVVSMLLESLISTNFNIVILIHVYTNSV
mgnify:CR=1 FL=1